MPLYGTRVPLPDVIVHRAFEAHVRAHPEQLALTCGPARLTFAELNAQANQFAHHLAALGAGRGSIIGVCLDRSPGLMVAILGVLKAGAAYVPLDPTYPPERLRTMIGQLAQIKLVVAAEETRELVESSDVEVLDLQALGSTLAAQPTHDPEVELDGGDLCYVVFTSGSTGTPKATAVRHEGWYNLLHWLELEYRLDTSSSGLALSAFGFDISQRGLMAPLFSGAAIHLLPSRVFDASMAYRLIGEHGVKTLHCAPSTLYLLIEQEQARGGTALTGVDFVFIGGEPLNTARVEAWATREGNTCTLLHQYGVAECTDVASSHPLAAYEQYRTGPTPVGPPVYNTEIWLLDEDLAEVPTGETGEICICGTSVSAGYLNAAPADASRFVEFQVDGKSVPLYRTGDRGYATPQGELVVVGRVDAQVKIRGMRIDLGDVEHGIRADPRVADAVVVAVKDDLGDLRLVAFVVPAQEELDLRALRVALFGVLPRNMVPQEIHAIAAFPLNPNGKTDRLALAARAAQMA